MKPCSTGLKPCSRKPRLFELQARQEAPELLVRLVEALLLRGARDDEALPLVQERQLAHRLVAVLLLDLVQVVHGFFRAVYPIFVVASETFSYPAIFACGGLASTVSR